MSFALFRGTANLSCNSSISNSSITTTTITNSPIDMQGTTLTGVSDPINPTDAVNLETLESYTSQTIGSVEVTLTNTLKSLIIPATTGSFIITVTNKVYGGPAATFSITKNHPSIAVGYSRMTSSAGLTTDERLHLFWDTNSHLMLYKDNVNYNGIYTVRIITNSPATTSILFVLNGVSYTSVIGNTKGSFMVAIINKVTGGPAATFSISKNEAQASPSITRISNSPGLTTNESLILQWNPNGPLQVMKNGTNYDGEYIIQIINISCICWQN